MRRDPGEKREESRRVTPLPQEQRAEPRATPEDDLFGVVVKTAPTRAESRTAGNARGYSSGTELLTGDKD